MAAEKENPQRGLTQNPRGPRTEHPHTRVGHAESGTVCRDCKLPKGSSEPALKDLREAAQNKGKLILHPRAG